MQQVARGARIALDAVFRDSAVDLVDPTTPLVDILDPANVVVVADTVPDNGAGLGLFDFPGGGYLVPSDAAYGVWTARWTGTVDGDLIEALDEFEVVPAVAPPDGDYYVTLAATNRAYVALAGPTAAQTTAQVKALSRQQNGMIRLLLGILDGTD